MLDLAQAVREQIVKETPPRKTEAPKRFALAKLRRFTLWAATAAAALGLAILSSRSEVGAERLLAMLHPGRAPSAAKFDAEAVTRQLAETVRVLAANDERLKARIAAVEHDLDDVTGSIRDVAAASEARRALDGPTVGATAAATASAAAPIETPPAPAGFQLSQPALPAAPAATQYGVDIGSGLTIQALRARWQALRNAHPALLEGLQPIVRVAELPHSSRIELRLVVGPLPQPGAATQLCSALTMFGMFCQPSIYDGQHLALK
jgi:hypothetical protein